ncbi:trypsin-like peptidase domain-containing protein [Bradyrhizobium rifense]|uniref:Trypsin-like peptidase domain-containing protein n=1 Tax=Bradyrhizobium rifense TaxID=515499 RepID=A0A5D3KBQ8_9BRAD|nr:serine protease [Bradyrhizobium rifense]TYL89968.1 trypsin-like peptidase domain-containing protein [Bradyrhizobium rifense]
MITLDQFTLTTVPLEQYFNDTRLGQGTGFMWKIQEKYYLVTNWHVLSMRDFFTGKNLRPDAGRPNLLRTLFNIQTGSFDKQQWDIKIRDDDDKPLWLVHPGRRVDVAVLPIPFKPEELIISLYPLNVLANAALRIEVGMEVFILGYPFEIKPPAYPVWKRGSIASEPQLARQTTDYMLVDTASRPGMSGAPVIRRSWTNHMVEPGMVALVDTPLNRFIGVYSGRVPTDHPHEAQIGLVWGDYLIHEIIAGNIRDE